MYLVVREDWHKGSTLVRLHPIPPSFGGGAGEGLVAATPCMLYGWCSKGPHASPNSLPVLKAVKE